MAVQRIPLFCNMNQRNDNQMFEFAPGTSKDAGCQNFMFSKLDNDISQSTTVYVHPRESFAGGLVTTGSGASTAVTSWFGKSDLHLAYARGDTNSNIYTWDGSGAADDRGAITGQGIHMSETMIGTTPNVVAISSSGSGRTWFYPDGGALTEITDTDFPPKQGTPIPLTGNFVHMDGYAFVMTTPGDIYNSDLNSLSSWNSTNRINAARKPDSGVGVLRYKDIVVGFSKTSTEFFNNTGNASGSVLSRMANTAIEIGCVGQHAMTNWKDTVAWVASYGDFGTGVFVLSGMQPKKISTPQVERALQTLFTADGSTTVRLGVLQSCGRQFLTVFDPANVAGVLVYDDVLNMWCHWTTGVGVYKTANYGARNVFATSSVGVDANQSSTFGDTAKIQTGRSDLGTKNKKAFKSVTWIGDMKAGVSLSLQLIFDDYQFVKTVTKTLDLSQDTPKALRCGMGRSVACYLSFTGLSSSEPFRGQALEFEFEPCST